MVHNELSLQDLQFAALKWFVYARGDNPNQLTAAAFYAKAETSPLFIESSMRRELIQTSS